MHLDLSTADNYQHVSMTPTLRVMMECFEPSVVRTSHLVAQQRLCFGWIVMYVKHGFTLTVLSRTIPPHIETSVNLVPSHTSFPTFW